MCEAPHHNEPQLTEHRCHPWSSRSQCCLWCSCGNHQDKRSAHIRRTTAVCSAPPILRDRPTGPIISPPVQCHCSTSMFVHTNQLRAELFPRPVKTVWEGILDNLAVMCIGGASWGWPSQAHHKRPRSTPIEAICSIEPMTFDLSPSDKPSCRRQLEDPQNCSYLNLSSIDEASLLL